MAEQCFLACDNWLWHSAQKKTPPSTFDCDEKSSVGSHRWLPPTVTKDEPSGQLLFSPQAPIQKDEELHRFFFQHVTQTRVSPCYYASQFHYREGKHLTVSRGRILLPMTLQASYVTCHLQTRIKIQQTSLSDPQGVGGSAIPLRAPHTSESPAAELSLLLHSQQV